MLTLLIYKKLQNESRKFKNSYLWLLLFYNLQPQKALLSLVIRELNQAGKRIKTYSLLNPNPLLDSEPNTEIW